MTTARPVALVTGASSGIGQAAASGLAGAGFKVVGTSRNAAGVSPRDGATFVDLDVADDASVTAGPACVRHQPLRRHPDDKGRAAAQARPRSRPRHQRLVRPGVSSRAFDWQLRKVNRLAG